jgi:hypothetical protein
MNAWLGMIVVATVWLIHLSASYFLAWADCATNQIDLLMARHLITAVALAITIAVGSLSKRVVSELVRNNSAPADTERVMEQSFMMRLTIAVSLMFLFSVVLAGAANLFIVPCA